MAKEVPLRVLLALAAAAVFLTVAGGGSPVSAAPKIEITLVRCDGGDPEVHQGRFDDVYLHNEGDSPQDLTGWKLKSDPEDSQVMSLDSAGTLDPVAERGAEPKDDKPRVIVVAGAHSVQSPDSNMWQWSISEILRDSGDPIDYVRLYDPAGNLVDSKDCNGNAVPLQTAVGATPTPSPQPASASNQPGDSTQSENQNAANQTDTRGGTGARAATGNQGAASAPVAAAGGSVPAPNSGVGSLAPVNAKLWPLTVIALAAGIVGLITGTVFLLRRGGKQDVV